MNLSKGFSVKGNIERAFELAQSYLSGMKYQTVNSSKPTFLVLKRGSRTGSTFSTKIDNVLTTLSISFSQKEENVNILCDYDAVVYGIVTSSDKSTLESEVEKLRAFLETAL